jgi:hypothetical protein
MTPTTEQRSTPAGNAAPRPWSPGSGSFTPPSAPAPSPFPLELRPTAGVRVHEESAKRRPNKVVTILLGLLVMTLVASAGVLVWKAFTPENVDAPVPAAEYERPADGVPVGATGVDPVDVEDETGGRVPMTTAAMKPSTLFIPALGVYMPVEDDARFVKSRYQGFDTLLVPKNARHGVRYAAGGPMVGGEAGTTTIAAHVSSSTGWGALRYLYKLKGGELIYTKGADGALQTWQMSQMRVENHTDFPQEYWAADGVRQLVVTTCGGSLTSDRHFRKNIFAVAVPVDTPPAAESAPAA